MQLPLEGSAVCPLPEKRKRRRRPTATSEAVRQERLREQWRANYYKIQAKAKAYAKEYQVKVRENRRATETPEQADERRRLNREWYAKKKAERRAKINAYLETNRERFRPARSANRRIRMRQRRLSDPVFRIVSSLRLRLYNVLRKAKANKAASTLSYLGCDLPTFMVHVETQWSEGMNWDNFGHGHGRWNIDHIKPCAAFRMQDESEQRACFHYTNLRPLWWSDNIAKNSMWDGRYWKHSDHSACVPAAPA